MKEYIVTKIILFLLNSGAGVEEHKLSTGSRCHIFGLAKAITKHIKNDSDLAALVAIGYKESKFNYEAKKWFTSPNGKHCGIYQQSPQFAILDGRKLNCRDLQSNDTATDQALSYIHYVIDTYGDRKLVDVDLFKIVDIDLGALQLRCKVVQSKLANIDNDISDNMDVFRGVDDDELIFVNLITLDDKLIALTK